MLDWELFDAIVDNVLQQNPSISPPMAGELAYRIMAAGSFYRKEDGAVILLPAPVAQKPVQEPAPAPVLAPVPAPTPKKHLSLEETYLRNRVVKVLIAVGEKRLAKASLDVSPIGETFLSILLDVHEYLHNELMLAFSANKGAEFLEDLETLEDPETGLVPLLKRHGIVPGRWTLEFHKEAAVKQPPVPTPAPEQEPETAAPSVTVTEGDNGLPTISVELVQPSTNFVVNPDGSIGEKIVAATEAVTVDNAFSLMQRANARRNQRRNHQRNAG